MSIAYKSTSGDYTITVNNGIGTFTVNANEFVVNGNLTYSGNLTTVDDFIVVAANNSGSLTDMGLLAQTGPTTFAGLRFDISANTWQISSSVNSDGTPVTGYANISTSDIAVGGSNTQVQFNNSGALAGNSALTFDYTTGQLRLRGYQAFGNIGNTPGALSNSTTLYSNTIGNGGTGMYIVSTQVSDELISATQARKFAIIF
jgi:hypothetical protein